MDWTRATDSLHTAFGTKKPAYKGYSGLFSEEQHPKTLSNVLIYQMRAILVKLDKNSLNEQRQIDMAYGFVQKIAA